MALTTMAVMDLHGFKSLRHARRIFFLRNENSGNYCTHYVDLRHFVIIAMQLQNSNDSATPSRAQLYLLGFLVGYCIIKRLKYHGIPENFPPGPPCIPLLGSAPFIQV